MVNGESMKVLVLGGNGFIGSRLISFLVDQGVSVRTLTRSTMKLFSESVEVMVGDLTDKDFSFFDLLNGCEVIINCVGELNDEALMYSLHVETTAKLLMTSAKLCAAGKPMHWVQLSSVGAYGSSNGKIRVVSEITVAQPVGTYETTKTMADDLIIHNDIGRSFTYSILRPSNVYGPNMTNNSLRQLGGIIKRKMFFYVGSSSSIATYVHVDDVVEALYLCSKDVRAKNELFNISNDCSMKVLIRSIAVAVDTSPPWITLPESLVRLAVVIVNKISKLPVTQKRIDALVQKTSYPTSKIESYLDFSPRKNVEHHIGELFKND
ncbi:hypothetical protein ALQ38_200012 [Pseudomonas marginalis pv. marginalis]|nr:hypothetical protein ALQ38_200012 [Pseudomonas marginalis pv. marginalis]